MSGPASRPVVLHDSPEPAAGGVLAFVHDGEVIELDGPNRRPHPDVSDEELARRRSTWKQPDPSMERGYVSMYLKHVMQADQGADFDFLIGNSGSEVPNPNH
jgi:dihydroxy-acid dehydratase